MLVFSFLESKRFNLNIFRSKIEIIVADDLKKQIIQDDIDVSIIRVPAHNKANHAELLKVGFPYIHADTLVSYSLNLEELNVKSIRNDLDFEIIDMSNSLFLDEMIPVIFKNYQNHYFSNPFLEKKSIIDGYIEWTKNYTGNIENRVSWYVKYNNCRIGFATCSFDINNKSCEGILYGVYPNYSGLGIYSDMIRFTQFYFKNLGYLKMEVSTQIQNYTVQKVWSREGFVISMAYDTFHINSFLKNKLK